MTGFVLLGYRPFLDPLNLHDVWWLLLVPLSLGIAVVYKAVRMRTIEWRAYWGQVALMTGQIVVGMLALAAFAYLLVMVYVRFIAEWS
jgi:hypothetical protein